jgi:hypothetical protein
MVLFFETGSGILAYIIHDNLYTYRQNGIRLFDVDLEPRFLSRRRLVTFF